MTTVTHSYNQSGTPDEVDRLAIIYLINEENKRRTEFNSTVPPPVTPLALLPKSNQAERKASVETIIISYLPIIWLSWIEEAKKKEQLDPKFAEVKDAWVNATTAQRNAGIAALKA